MRLKFPFAVVAKQRARLTRRRKGGKQIAYTPQATRSFENEVGQFWKDTFPDYSVVTEPVHVNIEIRQESFTVQVVPQQQSVRPVGLRGDVDNYVKSILDGLNGVAWVDDKQVEKINVKFVGAPRRPRRKVKP
jgi:crossover junction endodeoxyribonuclease RusA